MHIRAGCETQTVKYNMSTDHNFIHVGKHIKHVHRVLKESNKLRHAYQEVDWQINTLTPVCFCHMTTQYVFFRSL